jgi:hypothetical protein
VTDSVNVSRKASSGLHPETFVYHKPTDAQTDAMKHFTSVCESLVAFIDATCPASAEMTLALRKLEEARMRFNQAVVFYGTLEESKQKGEQKKEGAK